MSDELYHRPGQTADPLTPTVPKLFPQMFLKHWYNDVNLPSHFLNFDAQVAKFGDSVNIPILPRVTAGNVTPATGAYTRVNSDMTKSTLLIDKYKHAAVTIPDGSEKQSNIDIASAVAENGMKCIKEAMIEDMLALVSSFTTVTAVGSDSEPITEEVILKAIEALANQEKIYADRNPMDFCMILPIGCLHQVRVRKFFSEAAYTGEQFGGVNKNAYIPSIMRIPTYFLASDNLIASGTVGMGLLAHREAICTAVQSNPKLDILRGTGYLATDYVPNIMYGVLANRLSFGVQLRMDTNDAASTTVA